MSKKIVFSFPGGRGPEIPLLYFGAKYFEDRGYEKVFISHPTSGEKNLESLLENAESVIQKNHLSEYEDVVFIAKSIGTEVACKLKEKLNLQVSLVLFTPTEGALPYIRTDNDILLVAAAENDRHFDTNIVMQLCEREKVKCYVEPNVGHRMEVMHDLERNLRIISNVLKHLNATELVYHGSPNKYDTLIPHQAYDTGFEEGCQNAIYATTNKNMAIAFAMGAIPNVNGEVERIMMPEYGDKMVFTKGHPNYGGKGYLYVLDKASFVHALGSQWVCFEEIEPLEVIEIAVDDYLDLCIIEEQKA